MTVEQLISPAYLDEQRRLHESPRGYGQRGGKWFGYVSGLTWLHACESVLDYGCGQGDLGFQFHMMAKAARCQDVREYDPAIPGKDVLPAPADLVACTDVLEHVEEDKIDAVLDHLTSRVRKVLFVVVSLIETSKTLSDGRQAHILIRPASFWRHALTSRGLELLSEPSVKPEKQWVGILRRPGTC